MAGAEDFLERRLPFKCFRCTIFEQCSHTAGAGLGEGKGESNYEFNVLLHDYGDVQFATAEFEKLWDEGVEVLPAAIREVQEETGLNAAQYDLQDWQTSNIYEIYPHWRHR